MRNKAGFTLIEIIIVLVIIAVMAGVIVLNVSSSTYNGFLNQANKIAIMFEVIEDYAVYTNSVVVCEPNPTGLECQGYKNNEWIDLSLPKMTTWQWPKDMKIEQVLINGLPIKAGDKIRFTPNDNSSPMSIRVGNGVYNTWIDNDLSGNFKVSN